MNNFYHNIQSIVSLFGSVLCLAGTIVGCASQMQYFPIEGPTQKAGLTPFASEWFTKNLKAMQEPPLITATNNYSAKIYRLTILPSFDNPVAIRVEIGETVKLYSRRSGGEGGGDPGKLKESSVRELNLSETRQLQSLITAMNFFSLRVEDDEMANDGVTWVLEGVSAGKYHVICRLNPDSSRRKERNLVSFVEFAEFLISHSGLSKPPIVAKSDR